ncbi:MAG TPA: methyl-accepting chemotaxis protein [Rhodocyclaceae bacterium]|nr:methyl-accepting chemotaxis protein [Rhodocyclaceae bacterium]
MRNLKVAQRFLILASVFLIGMILIAVSGVVGMRSAVDGLDSVYRDRVVALRDLKVIADMYAVNIVDTAHKARNGGITYQQALKNVAEAEGTLKKSWDAYLATELVGEEVRLVNEIKPLMKASETTLAHLKDLLMRGDAEGLAQFTAKELYPAIDPLSGKFSDLSDVQLSAAKEEYESASDLYHVLSGVNLAISLVAAGLGLAMASFIARELIGQLGAEPGEVAHVASQIAQGKLGVDVVVKPGDDASVMAAMKSMRDELRKLVSGIARGAEQLASASSQMASTGEQVAAGSAEQSEATSSIASSVEEMTASIQLISESAGTAKDAASVAEQQVDSSIHVVDRTVDELRKISTTATATSQDIQDLARKSAEIGSIINVIKEIADQTNLLALNAAIEAARAGEQGRGFAVVADEVRKLAERTTSSTEEIVSMVNAIQRSTERTTQSTEEGRLFAEEGARLADEGADSMRAVKAGIDHTLTSARDISTALAEQSSTSVQISRNVERVAQMTEENSAAVASLNSAAGHVSQLAQELNGLVRRFSV